MKGRRAASVMIALLFMVSVVMPQALAGPSVGRPLQAAASTTTSHSQCFGYNQVDDSFIPKAISSLRIAVVQPVLTSTPYSQYNSGSFYAFYAKEQGVNANVTTNLNLLSTNVSSGYGFQQGWGLSYGMYRFLMSQEAVNCGLLMGGNVKVLTDMDVSDGALFHPLNRSARFDAVILPFAEYVTTEEYVAYHDFVAGGGTLVMMAHSLEYPVTYNATTKLETLVYGHGWAFNGKYGYPIACTSSVYVFTCPWATNNTNWIGSNTCMSSCFHTYKYNGSVVNRDSPIGKALYDEFGGKAFNSYLSHEEDGIRNMTGTSIVSVFVNDSTNLIAAYTHQFRKGLVVCMGIFGDDVIATDLSAQYFLLLGLVSAKLGPTATLTGSTTSTSTTTTSSTLVQTSASTTTTPQSPGTTSPVLIMLGGLTAVVVVAAAFVVLRKQTTQSA